MHFEHWANRILDPEIFVFVFVIVIVLAAIFCGMVVSIIKIFRGDSGKKKKGLAALEHQNASIDEVWDGLDRMEQRINNLETILLNRPER